MESRRDFLRQAALGAAALSVGGLNFTATAAAKSQNSSDVIRLGIAGVHGRGLGIAREVALMKDAKFVCVCDCDSISLEKCREAIQELTGVRPDGERDYRKMLERKDIDAVIIAMPDHWHAPAAIMALAAGKHVYVEKPTSHNPHENEMLLKAEAKYHKQVITVGNQRRSWPNVIKGVMEVKSGAIGEVHYAEAWYSTNRASIGVGKPVQVPSNLDWDLWQGPAPRVDQYKNNIVHYNWHWFRHWGTGEALNNGTHYVDILRWGLGVDYPSKVCSTGGRYHYTDDDWEFFDTQTISFEFGRKATMAWKGYSCGKISQDGCSTGMKFIGDGLNMIISSGNSYKIIDNDGKVLKEVLDEKAVDSDNRVSPSQHLDLLHFENWFDAIREGKPLNSTLRDACISTQLVQLGNISQFSGRSLTVDPYTGRIVDDREAMSMWAREYEPGWDPAQYLK